jgi:hypothetical protein
VADLCDSVKVLEGVWAGLERRLIGEWWSERTKRDPDMTSPPIARAAVVVASVMRLPSERDGTTTP